MRMQYTTSELHLGHHIAPPTSPTTLGHSGAHTCAHLSLTNLLHCIFPTCANNNILRTM